MEFVETTRKEIGAQENDKDMEPGYNKRIKWEEYHHVYMVLQEKEVSIWEDHKKIPPM